METGPASDPVADASVAFAALGHPHRLAVLRLLMQRAPQRMAAGQIGAALGLRPSTLSGYLAQLLESGLVTQERRGTSLLYGASVPAAQALSGAWLGDVCAGRVWPAGWRPARRVLNVLFLGAGNAGPTLLAEALLRALGGARCEVFSAGLNPAPGAEGAALAALRARGIEAEDLWPKPVSLWQGEGAPRMDVVIALGRRAAGVPWPGLSHRALWALPADQPAESLLADLEARIAPLAALDPLTTPPARLQDVLDRVSQG
jgi:arsenate reductase